MTKQTVELELPDGFKFQCQRNWIYKDEYYLTSDGEVAISTIDDNTTGLYIILDKTED